MWLSIGNHQVLSENCQRLSVTINTFFSAIIGYLLGNISSAYLYVRHVLHADIRELGSGNAGATNVNRILGLKSALQVFLLDVFKGAAAVLIGGWLAGSSGAMIAGLAVVAGHDWPVVMGFRGGKGMATTLGVMLILLPQVALIAVIIFVIIVGATRYISIGSIILCLVIAPSAAALGGSLLLVLLFVVLGLMGIFQHRSNIGRLLKGTESRLVLTRSTGGSIPH
jgi:glycerol-3-phosphate acyltransferase PlsY